MGFDKERLIAIAEDTVEISQDGYYINNKKEKIDIKNNMKFSIENSKLYKPTDIIEISENSNKNIIEVTQETTLKAGVRLSEEGYSHICILNFASAKYPGGGFLKGTVTQEECLSRESGMYLCIKQFDEMYNNRLNYQNGLYTDYMIYSPFVPFFKDDNFKLMDKPVFLSVITSPAVNKRTLMENKNHNLSKVDEVMKTRIEKIVKVAIENKVDALVLGAFGCGVFRNTPLDVSKYFNEVLGKYKGHFKKIVFAVYDNSPSKENYMTFNRFIKR